jgi:hypothetical protein
MSLRSDVKFVATTIVEAIRQILGETCQILADYLLVQKERSVAVSQEEEAEVVEVSFTPRQRKHARVSHRRETISSEPPPEVSEPEVKPRPRDRSLYKPKDHGGYKIAAIGVLQTLLSSNMKLSAPAIHKNYKISSDSTIRTACKTMVEDKILATEFSSEVRSDVYWILDLEAAEKHLAELRATAPVLPQSDESGESQASLD